MRHICEEQTSTGNKPYQWRLENKVGLLENPDDEIYNTLFRSWGMSGEQSEKWRTIVVSESIMVLEFNRVEEHTLKVKHSGYSQRNAWSVVHKKWNLYSDNLILVCSH